MIQRFDIPQGGNRMRLLNVLAAARDVVKSNGLTIEDNVQILEWALEALPEGWEELIEEEIVE